MLAFAVPDFVSSVLDRETGGKNVSEITYSVSSGS